MSSGVDSCSPGNTKRVHSESPLKEEKSLKVKKVGPGEINMADIAMLAAEMKHMSSKIDLQTERLEGVLRQVKTELSGEIGQLKDSVCRLRSQVDMHTREMEVEKTRVGLVQKVINEDRARINTLEANVEDLTRRAVEMEDRSRRNNVRLVGLVEGAEGSDAVGFLKTNLPVWLPSLAGKLIEVDRAHRIYSGRNQVPDRPRTLIFRLLRWQDRDAILSAAKKKDPRVRGGNSNLLFFADYSPSTTAKRKTFRAAMKMAHDENLRPFLIYPATIKLRTSGGPKLFDDPTAALEFIRNQSPGEEGATRPTSSAALTRARRGLFTDGPGARASEPAQAPEAAAPAEDIAVDP